MPHGQRDGHPDMPVEVFLVGWSRRGVVMDVGPFDLRTVPLGRRIVDDRQKPIRQRQGPKHQNQQLGGDGFALASECRQEVKIVLVIVADSGGPEPGRHGSSPVGEEDAHQQDRQSPAVAGVQPRRQPLAPLGPIVRTLPICFRHPWLSHHLRPGKRTVMEEPFSLQDQFRVTRGRRPFFQKVQSVMTRHFCHVLPTSSCRGARSRRGMRWTPSGINQIRVVRPLPVP